LEMHSFRSPTLVFVVASTYVAVSPVLYVFPRDNWHDVNTLDNLPLDLGAFYVINRGHIDFKQLHLFNQPNTFYVTGAKRNLDCTSRISSPVDTTTELRNNQTILLRGPKSSQAYPDALRRVSYYNVDTSRRFVYLTNNFVLAAMTIAQLDKARWRKLTDRWRCTTKIGRSETAQEGFTAWPVISHQCRSV